MKITVTEALRLKNELSNIVSTLNYSTNHASLGSTKEEDQVTSEGQKKFNDVISQLEKALSYSEEINNVLANFNREKGIDSKVRAMHNSKLLLNIFTQALPKTKQTTNTKFENLGNGQRKAVKVEYVPEVSSKDMKEKMATQKQKVRALQIEIEKLNQQSIDLSFEYSNIEELVD